MQRVHMLTLGLLARALSAVARFYSEWICDQVLDGATVGWHFVRDAVAFARWLLEALAQRLCERAASRHHVGGYGHEQLY